MVAKRLILIVAFLLVPSVVPRMQSSGGERWFVARVPDPERFRLDEHREQAREATWAFGYPFVFYFQVGREFETKDGSILFWPSTYAQPWLRQRVSLAALFGDIVLSIGIGVVLRFVAGRFQSRIEKQGESVGPGPANFSAGGDSNDKLDSSEI